MWMADIWKNSPTYSTQVWFPSNLLPKILVAKKWYQVISLRSSMPVVVIIVVLRVVATVKKHTQRIWLGLLKALFSYCPQLISRYSTKSQVNLSFIPFELNVRNVECIRIYLGWCPPLYGRRWRWQILLRRWRNSGRLSTLNLRRWNMLPWCWMQGNLHWTSLWTLSHWIHRQDSLFIQFIPPKSRFKPA